VEYWKLNFLRTIWPVVLLVVATGPASASNLDVLITAAIKNDQWLIQSKAHERAARAEAIAGGELPDPRLTASLANFPADTFDFSQEPMTQVMIGISQTFPSGDTRQLRRKQLDQIGDVSVIERVMRVARLRRDVTLLWADAALADETLRMIDEDRVLFEQLEAVIQSRYRSAGKGTNQQDLIRAELELIRLDERMLQLKERRQRQLEQLTQWVPEALVRSVHRFEIPRAEIMTARSVVMHPEVRIHDQRIEIARTGYQLAQESLRPGITINTSYGHRDEDRNGRDLPDFVSVGVSMDLPFFTAKRQAKQVTAAAERVAAEEAARLLAIRKLRSMQRDARERMNQLEQQITLYRESLLTQMAYLADAALVAYASDQEDFAEVMRARIAQLNARIEVVRLETERQKTVAQLQYLSAEVTPTGAAS
jgi:outer membrane protein TolC